MDPIAESKLHEYRRRHNVILVEGHDQRTVSFSAFGGTRATLAGEKFAACALEISELRSGPVAKLIDEHIGAAKGTRFEPAERLIVANRLLRQLGAATE